MNNNETKNQATQEPQGSRRGSKKRFWNGKKKYFAFGLLAAVMAFALLPRSDKPLTEAAELEASIASRASEEVAEYEAYDANGDVTGINFASQAIYEGKLITADDVTITATYADGSEAVVTDFILYAATAEHDGTTIMVETPYGVFDWEVPVIPASKILASYNGVAYEGEEVGIRNLTFTVEYENGYREVAPYSLMELPAGTVSLGMGETIYVGYNGVEYPVDIP